METADYVDALRREGPLLAGAAGAAGLDATVPSCPEWTVRELVRHQGGVHRWALAIVSGPRTEPWDVELDEVVGSWPDDPDLLEWFLEGHGALVTALAQAEPDLACWTFLRAPSSVAMWSRRQAHETPIHRVDAELARGGPVTAVEPPVADDGVDELLRCFITRPGRGLVADPARVLGVGCLDTPGSWLVRIGPSGVETSLGTGPADCTVTGSATDLYRALWHRKSANALTVDGDRGVLDLFLDRVHVRWS